MFLKTFTTTMKRIFRSPAMLFSIPAILIMLQQRTQIITKSSSPDNLFIQGGYFYQIYTKTPADYIWSQLLFNAVIIPITHCLPIIIAVMLALILRDFYNSSERDILFATNIPFGKYYLREIGTAINGITVALQLCNDRKTTSMTSNKASNNVLYTSEIDSEIYVVMSNGIS